MRSSAPGSARPSSVKTVPRTRKSLEWRAAASFDFCFEVDSEEGEDCAAGGCGVSCAPSEPAKARIKQLIRTQPAAQRRTAWALAALVDRYFTLLRCQTGRLRCTGVWA